MPKGVLYDIGEKKWRSVEEIKANINAQIDALGERSDVLDEDGNVISKSPSPKTIANAKNVMGGLVDAIDESNKELPWQDPDNIWKV